MQNAAFFFKNQHTIVTLGHLIQLTIWDNCGTNVDTLRSIRLQ